MRDQFDSIVGSTRRADRVTSNSCNEPVVLQRNAIGAEGPPMFQIVRLMLDAHGYVAVRRPLQPLYELREDATAMAEFDCCRLGDDYGYDEERDCWWAVDGRGRVHRFEIKQVVDSIAAA